MGSNETSAAAVKNNERTPVERNVAMIGNKTVISRVFREQRAFVHWYADQGMAEGEFAEAREDLEFLEKDYLNVLSEQAKDEEDDDEIS